MTLIIPVFQISNPLSKPYQFNPWIKNSMKTSVLSIIFTHYGKPNANEPLIIDEPNGIMDIPYCIVHNWIMDIPDLLRIP